MVLAIDLREAVSLAGRFPLLSGITLSVGEGEVVHLRGANGAGKTSVLRLCAGLLRVSGGSASVLGHDLATDRRTLRREVHLLGHSGFLYDELTVEDNVRFAVRAARGDVARVLPALERLELTGRLRRTKAGSLSLGQRRRCGLAVLLARSPRLWLLDEPHAGIDERGRVLVDELIAEARAVGSSVLFASHELDRASAVADRTVQLAGGRAVEADTAPLRPVAPPTLVQGVGADVA
jgi:ABC-type multidrug transport system ATPase subunit